MDAGAGIRRSTFVTSAGQPGVYGGLAGFGGLFDSTDPGSVFDGMSDADKGSVQALIAGGLTLAQAVYRIATGDPNAINPATGHPYNYTAPGLSIGMIALLAVGAYLLYSSK